MIKFNKEFFVGLTLGFTAGVAVGAVNGKEKVNFKNISRSVIRSSLLALEKVKEVLVRTKENLEDLTAEVKTEIRSKGLTETSLDLKKRKDTESVFAGSEAKG